MFLQILKRISFQNSTQSCTFTIANSSFQLSLRLFPPPNGFALASLFTSQRVTKKMVIIFLATSYGKNVSVVLLCKFKAGFVTSFVCRRGEKWETEYLWVKKVQVCRKLFFWYFHCHFVSGHNTERSVLHIYI